MKIAPFRALYPDTKYIKSADSFFDAVKYEYSQYYKNGFFKKTSQEALYLYEIQSAAQRHLGLVATVDIREYLNGNIKVHENTLAAKEQKTTDLILERRATIKPLLLSYTRNDELHELLLKIRDSKDLFYELSFEEDGNTHRIWKIVEGNTLEDIQSIFDRMEKVYIADGHHRMASMANLYNMSVERESKLDFQWVHVAFFSFDQLEIHDYNRIVTALEDRTPSQLMASLSQYFDIREIKGPNKPKKKHHLTFTMNKEWYDLFWKKDILKKYKDQDVLLDTALFDKYVLNKIIGVEDVRSDQRVDYVGGSKGIEGIRKILSNTRNNVAFCLPPVTTKEFVQVSDAGQSLPPKSTWFEPRLKNGLIVHRL